MPSVVSGGRPRRTFVPIPAQRSNRGGCRISRGSHPQASLETVLNVRDGWTSPSPSSSHPFGASSKKSTMGGEYRDRDHKEFEAAGDRLRGRSSP